SPAAGTSAESGTPSPWVTGFESTVASSHYSPAEQVHFLILELKTGTMPSSGETLAVLDADGVKKFEIRVMQIYDETTFGGRRLDSAIAPAPLAGDRVVRPRVAE